MVSARMTRVCLNVKGARAVLVCVPFLAGHPGHRSGAAVSCNGREGFSSVYLPSFRCFRCSLAFVPVPKQCPSAATSLWARVLKEDCGCACPLPVAPSH